MLITFKSKEKVTPCWSWNLVFSSIGPCLFSSQVPLLLFIDGILKLVEEHLEFLMQVWLHDVRLGDWNLLKTRPFSCLSCRVVINTKYWTRKFGVFFGSVNNDIHHSLKQDKKQNVLSVHYLTTEFGTEWKVKCSDPSASCAVKLKARRLVYSCTYNTWMWAIGCP